MSTNEMIDVLLQKDEKKLLAAINQTNMNPGAWSPSEVREIAELALGLVHYIQKLRKEKELRVGI